MKANKVPENMYIPEKIYLPYKDGKVIGLVKETGVPYKSGVDGNIEYVRADAFIEKACVYFRTLDDKEPPYETTEEFIEGFIKAMKL